MNRRELLKMIAVLTGGAVVGGDVFLLGCKTETKTAAGFSKNIIALLNKVGETIIPTTSTPGAKAAMVGEFMQVIVTDCYTQKEQDAFMKGIAELDRASDQINGKKFMDCSPQQRHDLLVSLEKDAKEFNKQKEEREKPLKETAEKQKKEFISDPPHYYTMIKQLTLWGYFSSEIGAKTALRHNPIPGKYDGAYPYKKGDKAWSE